MYLHIFICFYRALSGTTKDAERTISMGSDVASTSFLQSEIQSANHGSTMHAPPKYKAIDIFATQVRWPGPTYSNTVY